MKVIDGLKELEILVHNFFVCLVETFDAYVHHGEETCIFVIHSWIELCAWNEAFYFHMSTIVFVHDLLFSSKRCLVHDRNVHKIFSILNLTIICIKPFFHLQ